MQIATKSTPAVKLVQTALEKAQKFSDYNIFTQLCQEEALHKAALIDQKLARGESVGPLAGVPYALKDNFLAPLGHTTASARILEPFRSPVTATSVEKLERAGAICIGRTNMDAFAHGSSTENSCFGPTKNSADPARVAGGSSGGSAAAVALGIVQFATGTDTGGSIRQPASFNGVYGFKPTYGTISRYGVVAMASSTDCVGFFTRSAADLDLLMQICSGQDAKDMTSLPDYYQSAFALDNSESASELTSVPNSSSASTSDPDATSAPNSNSNSTPTSTPKTIGLIKDFDNDSIKPEIRQALATQVAHLKSRGHRIVELSMPTLKYALAVYYIVVPAEISSNLSRHDGIRYGLRAGTPYAPVTPPAQSAHPKSLQSASPELSNSTTPEAPASPDPSNPTTPENPTPKSLSEVYTLSRDLGFMPENKRRIMIGNFVLSSGFYDAYYLKAQKARTLLIREYEQAFQQCDFILTPVSPSPAFKLGEKTSDPVAMYLEDILTVPVSLAGLPALSIPVSIEKDNALSPNYITLSAKSQDPAAKTASAPDKSPLKNPPSNPSTPVNLPIGLQLIGPRRSDPDLLKFAEEFAHA